MLSRRRFPPPGRLHLPPWARGELLLAAINPKRVVTLRSRRTRLPRDEGHSPRIMADIDGDARGGKSAIPEFGGHVGLAVALQADAAAQLPVIRQRGRDQPNQGVAQKTVMR